MPAPDVGASTALRAAYVASEWHRFFSAFLDESNRAKTDDERNALNERLGDMTRAISAKPVRTPGDLVVRAAIAAHWYGDEISDPSCTADHVVAAVVRGVLDLAGLKFDVEGRLLGVTSALPND